jgi:CBS domain containing-hemolysin-like protein
MGRVPRLGEAIEREGLCIEVTASNERHVEQVRVSRSGFGQAPEDNHGK